MGHAFASFFEIIEQPKPPNAQHHPAPPRNVRESLHGRASGAWGCYVAHGHVTLLSRFTVSVADELLDVPGIFYCLVEVSLKFSPARNSLASAISGLMLSAWRHSTMSFL